MGNGVGSEVCEGGVVTCYGWCGISIAGIVGIAILSTCKISIALIVHSLDSAGLGFATEWARGEELYRSRYSLL